MPEVPRPPAERPAASGQEGNRYLVLGFPWAAAVPFYAGLQQVLYANGGLPVEGEV